MDLNSMIYKEPVAINPGRGDLLLAEPLLDEPYFRRSVIMILDEDSGGGHIGLVLNKRTPVTLQDLFPDWEAGAKVPVYSGGPVEADRLFMLHKLGDVFEGAMEVIPGLYVGAKLDDVLEYIQREPDVEGKIRFFLGYSGWTKGQLTSEILKNTWALNATPDSSDLLTGCNNDYWRREVENLGSKYKSWLLVPSNPSYN